MRKKSIKNKFVKIEAEIYYELLQKENELDALECVGVDNWDGYSDRHDQMDSDKTLLEEVYSKIIE